MGIYIYGVVNTILFVILGKLFMEIFESRRRYTNRWYGGIIILCQIAGLYGVSVILDGKLICKEIVVLTLNILCMWLYFNQTIWRAVACMLLYQASGLIIDYVTIIVASKCFSNITMDSLHESMVNVLLGVLSQTFLLVFLMILHRYVIHTSSDMLTEAEWLRFAIFPIFTIVVLISLLVGFEIPLNERQKSILICISIGLIGMNIVVFYLINSILKREMELRENKIFLERVKNETEMYRSISENYDKQRKREHEYQNHMQVISDLLKNKKYQELERFIDESNSDTAGKIDKIDTNHVIVNSILNTKYREAREKKIVFVVKVNDLSTLKIKDEDIVLILSNLLNNAIEACEKSERPVIKVKIMKEQKQIIIAVINTIDKEPKEECGKFITSKEENTELHGIGIQNIKDTVEKYGGTCVIRYDQMIFQFIIVISEN